MFEAYSEGWDAYYKGEKFKDCPYSTLGISGQEWKNGWIAAAEEHQLSPPSAT